MTDPKVDVQALAKLARLAVSEEEIAKLEREIPAILKFVEQIQSVVTDTKPVSPSLRNVVRADQNPHASGAYTEKLLDAAPKTEKSRVVVKQVLSRRKASPSGQEK